MDEKLTKREIKLQHIYEVEQMLNEIQDVDILLERILTETRRFVDADAGSIYLAHKGNLKIKYAQNDTQLKQLPAGEKLPYLCFSFPINENSIAGYVAANKQTLIFDDVYNIPEDMPFKFNRMTDMATNYRTKSMITIPLKMNNGHVLGVLQIINKIDKKGNVTAFNKDDEILVSHFANSAVQPLQNAYKTKETHKKMLKMSEFRDPKETFLHVERVSSFSLEIYDRWAFENNIPENEKMRYRDNLKVAAKFHDIGKIGISDLILKKPGRFTDDERNIMKGHTCLGALLFDPPESESDKMCMEVALYHHERWDGGEQGYPGSFDYKKYQIGNPVEVSSPLKGNDIPLSARIVAVADVFDALSHRRCYKEAWSLEDSFKEIENSAGTQFDPQIVLSFLHVKERIVKILQDYQD